MTKAKRTGERDVTVPFVIDIVCTWKDHSHSAHSVILLLLSRKRSVLSICSFYTWHICMLLCEKSCWCKCLVNKQKLLKGVCEMFFYSNLNFATVCGSFSMLYSSSLLIFLLGHIRSCLVQWNLCRFFCRNAAAWNVSQS